jgi:DnaB-like helicase N terminal domain
MPDISYHAEQAVLGALLAEPDRAADVGELTALDFADPRHQAIFTALTSGSEPSGSLFGRLRDWLARLPLRSQLRQLDEYIAELPDRCPDPASLPAYTQMVTEASRQRGTHAQARAVRQADPASYLEQTAAFLDEQSRKAAEQARHLRRNDPAGGMPGSGLPRDVEQLARAMGARSNRAAPAPAPAQPAEPAAGPSPAGRAGTHRQPEEPVRPEEMQELILADLLQRPRSARDLTWLPPEVFTAGPLRQLYTVIRDRASQGLPVDPLIIAWETRTTPAPAQGSGGRPAGQASPEDVLRIGALDTAPGTALLLGRALLAEHVMTERFGADWPQHADRIRRPAPSREPLPDVAAEPGPAQAPAGHQQRANGAAPTPAAARNAALLQPPPEAGAPQLAPRL